jgi:hypothetical protein
MQKCGIGCALQKCIHVNRWIKVDNSYRDDPLIRLFPRNMGCDMAYYGPSGTREFKEFKCESPYNNANEFIHVAAFF